jgi:sugar phosphate isomerase/epimerase
VKLGFVSAILPELSLDEVLSFASREGFTAVEVMRIGYDGPVCIEVEDDTFGASLEGRMNALRVARNVLAPFFG